MSDEDKQGAVSPLSTELARREKARQAHLCWDDKREDEVLVYLYCLRERYGLPEMRPEDWERSRQFGSSVLFWVRYSVFAYFIGKGKPELARRPFGATAKEEAVIVRALKTARDACLAANKALGVLGRVAGGAAHPRLTDALAEKTYYVEYMKRLYEQVGLDVWPTGKHGEYSLGIPSIRRAERIVLPATLPDVCSFQNLLIATACEDAARRTRPAGRPTEDRTVVAQTLVEALRCFLLQMPTTSETQGLADLLFGKGNLDVKQAVTEAYRDIRPEEIEACLRRLGREPEAIFDREERLAAIREAFRSAYRHGKRKGKGAVGDRLDAILTPELMDKLYRQIWPE